MLAGTGDFPRVQPHRLTRTHTRARSHKAHVHGRRDTCTPTHTHVHCPLSLFVLPLADFVFADNRWADIDSLLNNKYTLRLSLSASDISLSVHLAVFTSSLRRNPSCAETIPQLFPSLGCQAKIPNVRSFQPLERDDLLLFAVL